MFTYDIISSFMRSLCDTPDVPDVLRTILTLSRWSNNNCSMTTWVIELVIAGVCINGNSIHVLSAKDELEKELQVFEPLTTSVLP